MEEKTTPVKKNIATPLVVANENQTKISKAFGYTPEEIFVIQNNVAKGTTNTELAYFINVCKTMDLNPFNKEVWCYKDNKGNLLIFAGRDGFLSKAQKNPLFNGIRSMEVCVNDEFTMDVANNKIVHNPSFKNRGDIIGAYCIVFRKGGEPTVEWSDCKVYDKGRHTWSSHKAEMIKKVAECHALKKAFGISGIQSQYDFEVQDGIAVQKSPESRHSAVAEIMEEGVQND